jgi:general secretion pathway protein K
MLVLWVVIVLGAIAVGVVAASRSSMDVVTTVRARSLARYAAESGVVAATTRLQQLMAEAGTIEEQARVFQRLDQELAALRERRIGQAWFQVAILDLNSRLDLNASDELVLRSFFEGLFGESRGSELLDALQDWKDENDSPRPQGAEAEQYLAAGSVFVPPNRPLQRLDELTRIEGFTDSIVNVLAPLVTIRSDGRVNINTAPEPVVAAVTGAGSTGETLLGLRGQIGTFGTMNDVRSSLLEGGGAASSQIGRLQTLPSRVLIVSRGWADGHPLTHEIQAVFDLEGLFDEEGARLEIHHWVERDL